jgi:hypothetical protein
MPPEKDGIVGNEIQDATPGDVRYCNSTICTCVSHTVSFLLFTTESAG